MPVLQTQIDPGAEFMTIAAQELARCGAGGVLASLLSHSIGCPPIVNVGSEALKRKVLPAVLRGEKISAVAITEPSGGSDVANLKTTARRDGDHYVINGSKTFITSGMRADFYTVAVRTGRRGSGWRVLAAGGGAEEVMRDLAARQLGFHNAGRMP